MNDIIGWEDMKEPLKTEVAEKIEEIKKKAVDDILFPPEWDEHPEEAPARAKMSFGNCLHALAVVIQPKNEATSDAHEYLLENIGKISTHEKAELGAFALKAIMGMDEKG